MTDDDHLRQRGVGTSRVEFAHGVTKGPAQQRRRIEYRVAGIVSEKLELVPVADAGVIKQII